VVKNLDRLSDLLCGVIDLCELVRNVHPDEAWVSESDSTYERLCSFMNELNTDTGLYKVSLSLQSV
jgi:intermediate peptidase